MPPPSDYTTERHDMLLQRQETREFSAFPVSNQTLLMLSTELLVLLELVSLKKTSFGNPDPLFGHHIFQKDIDRYTMVAHRIVL